MAIVLVSRSNTPKYVPNLKEGGEKKPNEKTNPFRWMIENFSTILNQGAVTHYSGTFKACDLSWKLQLEPNSSAEDGEKSLSLCLSAVDTSSSTSLVVKAVYKLTIYDQLHGKHVEKEGDDYFHNTSRCGLCCTIPLKQFNNPKSGLLVNDCCIFGAEILEAFPCKLEREGVSECLSLKKEVTPQTYTWVIKDFSKLNERQVSGTFTTANYFWRISLYPNVAPYKNFLAMFLLLDNAATISSKTPIYVDYSLCLLDQVNGKHKKSTVQQQFSSAVTDWGWPDFLAWEDVKNPSRGFIRNDTCIIEASVTVLGSVGIS